MSNLQQRLVTDLVFREGEAAPAVSPTVNELDAPGAVPSVLLGPIAAGTTIIVEHGIHQAVLGDCVPNIVFPDRATPLQVLSCNATTVTIYNPTDADLEVTFRVERKHTIEEDPGLLTQMLWKGTVDADLPDVLDMDGSGCVPAGVSVVRYTTEDVEPLIYLPSLEDVPDGHEITLRRIDGELNAIILPNNLEEGVEGDPGATLTVLAAELVVRLEADRVRSTWWKV